MSGRNGPSRRAMLKVGLAGAATVASPAILRLTAEAQSGPIKIGMPLALTGALGTVGQQQKRGAEFWAKMQNAKGGILGRPIQLLIEDTAGNPANTVRKAQEMVERENCRLFTGITLSSEALAVVPKLAEWDSIFISSDNGDGRLTAESFVPNFFRANISGPMGTRAVSLYLRKEGLELRDKMTFEEFIEWMKYSSSTCIHPVPHVNQLDWLVDPHGNVLVDFIGRFENLAADWATIAAKIGAPPELPHTRKNPGRNKPYTEYYSERTRRIIEDRFRVDIEYFGYKFGA